MNDTSKLKHKAPESLLHALSDPTRQEIVQILAREGELTAAGIYGHFNVSKPAISQHLAILRDAGLVNVEKRAQFRIYSLNARTMEELESWTSSVRKIWESRFREPEKVLEQQKKGAEREVEKDFEPFEDGTRIKLAHRGLPDNGHKDKAATEIAKSLVQLSSMIDRPQM